MGGGVECFYIPIEEAPADAIVINGDVNIDGDLVVDYTLLVTGDIKAGGI